MENQNNQIFSDLYRIKSFLEDHYLKTRRKDFVSNNSLWPRDVLGFRSYYFTLIEPVDEKEDSYQFSLRRTEGIFRGGYALADISNSPSEGLSFIAYTIPDVNDSSLLNNTIDTLLASEYASRISGLKPLQLVNAPESLIRFSESLPEYRCDGDRLIVRK